MSLMCARDRALAKLADGRRERIVERLERSVGRRRFVALFAAALLLFLAAQPQAVCSPGGALDLAPQRALGPPRQHPGAHRACGRGGDQDEARTLHETCRAGSTRQRRGRARQHQQGYAAHPQHGEGERSVAEGETLA
jgi:hypothetical protein